MSQMSREDMLRELELLPVWQLRQPLPTLYKVETPAAGKSEQVVTEQLIQQSLVQEQDIPVAEMQVIDIDVAGSALPEPSIPESSIPETAPSATPVLEAPVLQHIEAVESVEEALSHEPVLEKILPLQLRLLLSEDSSYAFLIEPYAVGDDVQQIETLLKNMIRAMQASCRVDVTDSTDKIFAVHTPKLIISLGAESANRLSGEAHTIDEWRNIQQQNQPLYEQIPLMVTYHPAHLLKNNADKGLAWRDLCAAMKLVQNL